MDFPQANGGRPPVGSYCAKHEARLDDLDDQFGQTLLAATEAKVTAEATHKVALAIIQKVDDRFDSLERSLAVQLARAEATIEATERERGRESERAEKLDARRWTKWQKVAAIAATFIAAVLTSLGTTGVLEHLLK